MLYKISWAEDISVEASVSANKVSLKEAAQLTLAIRGGKDIRADAPQLPKIDGFDVRYMGPSTRISIVNGQYSSERSFVYNLFPTKTGRLQIPALTVQSNGQNYATKPIDMEVVDGPMDRSGDANASAGQTSASAGQANAPGPAQGGASEKLSDRVFMVVSTPKAQVYLGEKVPISVKLFIMQLPVRNVQYPKIDKSGFTMENFPQPQQYSQVLNGMKYDVVDFKTFIYPNRSGDVSIGPVQIEGGLLYKAQGRRASGGLFDDDFFNGFFDSYQERPLTVNSQALRIKVLDLPPEGKPADFSGAVGQLDFTASIAPAQVKVGDPVTLRMTISGDGNLKSIPMPAFNDSAFKTYEPQIKDEGNTKVLEQVIIPTSEKITAVPALSFSYFDPVAGRYKTLTQGPFALKVTAPVPGQEFKAVGFTNLPQGGNVQIQQVDYVQTYIQKPLEKAIALCKRPKFWLMLLSFAAVWGLWMGWVRFNERLARDTAFARRVNALRQAKQGMKQARKYLNTASVEEFYNAVFKTLNSYLADKFHKPAGSLSWDQVRLLLEQKKLPPEQVNAVKEIFDTCDMVRFAGGQTDTGRMSADLAKFQAVIVFLEKNLK